MTPKYTARMPCVRQYMEHTRYSIADYISLCCVSMYLLQIYMTISYFIVLAMLNKQVHKILIPRLAHSTAKCKHLRFRDVYFLAIFAIAYGNSHKHVIYQNVPLCVIDEMEGRHAGCSTRENSCAVMCLKRCSTLYSNLIHILVCAGGLMDPGLPGWRFSTEWICSYESPDWWNAIKRASFTDATPHRTMGLLAGGRIPECPSLYLVVRGFEEKWPIVSVFILPWSLSCGQ